MRDAWGDGEAGWSFVPGESFYADVEECAGGRVWCLCYVSRLKVKTGDYIGWVETLADELDLPLGIAGVTPSRLDLSPVQGLGWDFRLAAGLDSGQREETSKVAMRFTLRRAGQVSPLLSVYRGPAIRELLQRWARMVEYSVLTYAPYPAQHSQVANWRAGVELWADECPAVAESNPRQLAHYLETLRAVLLVPGQDARTEPGALSIEDRPRWLPKSDEKLAEWREDADIMADMDEEYRELYLDGQTESARPRPREYIERILEESGRTRSESTIRHIRRARKEERI